MHLQLLAVVVCPRSLVLYCSVRSETPTTCGCVCVRRSKCLYNVIKLNNFVVCLYVEKWQKKN